MRTHDNCSQVRELLEEYFEGTLLGSRRDKVAAHFAVCPGCTAELHQLEKMVAALAAVPQAEVGAHLLRAIAARAAELPAPGGRRALARGWRQLGVWSAACLAFLAMLRYVVPVIWHSQQAHIAPVIAWVKTAALSVAAWVAALPTLAKTALVAAGDLCTGLGAVGRAVAPTLGLYVAAEVGIVLAIVFLFGWGRTRVKARVTFLV